MTIYHQASLCYVFHSNVLVPTGAVVLARYVPVGTSSPLLILSVVHNSSKEETPVIFVFYQTTGSIAMLAMAPVLSTLPIAIFSYVELYDLHFTKSCHQITPGLK